MNGDNVYIYVYLLRLYLVYQMPGEWRRSLYTLLRRQSRLGGKLLGIRVYRPQNETAVLKGSMKNRDTDQSINRRLVDILWLNRPFRRQERAIVRFIVWVGKPSKCIEQAAPPEHASERTGLLHVTITEDRSE